MNVICVDVDVGLGMQGNVPRHPPPLTRLQEQRIHLLANGRPLGHGDYKDASRPLRRLLKQYGNGNLEAGLRYVAGSQAAQAETIALLSVDKPVGFLVTQIRHTSVPNDRHRSQPDRQLRSTWTSIRTLIC
jgi:hypothetical protein